MKTILVSLDLSEQSASAADRLVDFAAGFGGPIAARTWLVHVVNPDVDPPNRLEFVAQDIRNYIAGQLRQERLKLHQYAQRLAALGIEARPLLVRGLPAETIVQEAKRHHADLLVMGWPRHSSFYRTLLGSVTDSVMRDCPCPVLVMPQPARKTDAPEDPRHPRESHVSATP